ncbi:MAG: hypothetical protein AAB646_02125 [Patescibacteria group bacterium]
MAVKKTKKSTKPKTPTVKEKTEKPIRQAPAAAKAKAGRQGKPIGVVTHYYGNLEVAIVKFKKPVKVGAKICFSGATSDFDQIVESMQYEHKPITAAKKGQEVGIKVAEKVREGDEIYEVK